MDKITELESRLRLQWLASAKRYVVALGILAALTMANYAVIDFQVNKQAEAVKLTDLASNHRIDFQRTGQISKFFIDMIDKGVVQPRSIARAQRELSALIDKIRDQHNQLRAGVLAWDEGHWSNETSIRAFLDDEPHRLTAGINDLLAMVEILITADPARMDDHYNVTNRVSFYAAINGRLMTALDDMNAELSAQSTRVSMSLTQWHNILTAMTLFTLLLEYLFLFRPLLRRLKLAHEDVIQKHAELDHQNRHDMLTGLMNRAAFQSDIERACQMIGERNQALILIDLDGFKAVNDTMGHLAGDEVLVNVAQRMREVLRNSDGVYRLGGDEFAVIARISPNQKDSEFMGIANRLIAKITEPMQIEGHLANVGASIGIRIFDRVGYTPDQLVHEADSAMYAAKNAGKGQALLFKNMPLLEGKPETSSQHGALVPC